MSVIYKNIYKNSSYFKGCDTTSKVGSKRMGLQVTLNGGFELLHSFGKEPLTQKMLSDAEEFLVHCVSKSTKSKRFDDLRYTGLLINFY